MEREDQLADIIRMSHGQPQLIFKHSVTCGISAYARERLGMATHELAEKIGLHYLDLLAFRPVSNLVASELAVPHQSPQAILISKGKVVYHASHSAIQPAAILSVPDRP
ncbi:MAG: bacillithiol system redox-active protein YtxJ [Bacteroidetes bacterium]|nr:MAG: bacillithiol system redox-active protein YtxJ [Bacteroidota bacterium]